MLRAPAAGLLVALLAAGPAFAGGTITPLRAHLVAGAQHLAGPAFAGDGIAWATASDFDGGYDVSVLRGGQTDAQHVTSYGQAVVETDEAFAASPDAVALAVNGTSCNDPDCRYGGMSVTASTVFAGPYGGPPLFRLLG